jgi:ComF family protein
MQWVMSRWLQLRLLFLDCFHVLFPDLCLGCLKNPKTHHASFCVDCLHQMPYTDHFLIPDNDVTKHFRGRIKVHHGAALLRFREGSIVQTMLHGLKYKRRREIGEVFGEIAGKKLLESPLFVKPDLIIPVPVHPKKVLKRGYNQSSVFGMSVAKTIGVEFNENVLIKKLWSESQTGMNRSQRISNVEDVFVLNLPESVRHKHVLIVDDVVTTGATLEACCLQLMHGEVDKISILTIASTVG